MSKRVPNRPKMAASIIQGASAYQIAAHENGFKTACTTAVLGFFGIDKKSFKFCQTREDMGSIFNRNGFSLVNVGKRKETKSVVGKAVKNIGKHLKEAGFYLVTNPTHVLLAYVSDSGEVSFPVDTAPEHNRRVESIHRIKNKSKKA